MIDRMTLSRCGEHELISRRSERTGEAKLDNSSTLDNRPVLSAMFTICPIASSEWAIGATVALVSSVHISSTFMDDAIDNQSIELLFIVDRKAAEKNSQYTIERTWTRRRMANVINFRRMPSHDRFHFRTFPPVGADDNSTV